MDKEENLNPFTACMTRRSRHGKCIPVRVYDETVSSWLLRNAGSTFSTTNVHSFQFLDMVFSYLSDGAEKLN